MKLSLTPNDWVTLEAGEVFGQISTSLKKVKTKECKLEGAYPVIDQGQEEVSGYVDDPNKVISIQSPIVIFGDHTRAVKWVDHDFVPGADGTKVLEPKQYLHPRYFYYQLQSIELPDKGYARHFKFLKESEFAVAPLAEQKQIAVKLDELLAQVDTLKTRLDAIPAILKRFRQSVLAAAVSGRLTEEWRDKQGIDSWVDRPLSDFDIDIQIGPFGSLLHKSDYVMDGVPLVNPMHIVDGKIQASKSMTVSREKILELKRYKLITGDIVLGRRGEMGRAAVVGDEDVICGTGSLFLRPNKEQHESHFLRMFLASPETIKYLESGSVGSTMTNLNQKILKSMPVPNVSKDEQTEIVRRVEQLFAFTDQIEQRVKDAQSRVNHLTQSILAKAFRGELTAEWREQNPDLISGEYSAEALLEKIKAEQAVVKPAKKTTRRKTG